MEQWKRGRIIVYASKDGEKGLRVVTEACGEETVDFYSLKQIREFIEHYEKPHDAKKNRGKTPT